MTLPPPQHATQLAALRDELVAANINPKTGLSTDYLNHFNEMVMMIEIYPGAPDVREEILAWSPLNYRDHFETSGFRARGLALKAYALSDPALRKKIDAVVAEIDTILIDARLAVATGELGPAIEQRLTEATGAAELLIARASALINGRATPADADTAQAAVDALFVQ